MRFIAALILTLTFNFAASYWWATGIDNTTGYDDPQVNPDWFTPVQQKLLADTPSFFTTVGKGAQYALKECQRQFKQKRWSCSKQNNENVFGNILDIACRETAFIHAITSAGLIFSMTNQFQKGLTLDSNDCFLDSVPRYSSKKKVRRCFHKAKTVYELVHKGKLFTDAKETTSDLNSAINKHNSKVGRWVTVKAMFTTGCYCHGVTGSCAIKSCRSKIFVTPFQKIGNALMRSYKQAIKVDNLKQILHNETRLVYAQSSPDFCTYDSLGMKGRNCRPYSDCKKFCCGRPVAEKWITHQTTCKCVFKWCCKVMCQSCTWTSKVGNCL